MTRRLIVTADDFGMSREVNEAVEEAHRKGVLSGASLVVSGDAAGDALERARRLPDLDVGLHLALYGAPAQAELAHIGLLLRSSGDGLGYRPIATGALIALSRRAQAQAQREIEAQFQAFERTGLRLAYLDGHWHCHQHPFLLRMLLERGRGVGLSAVRVPYEPPLPSWRAAGRRGLGHRFADACAHRPLAVNMRAQLRKAGVAHNDWFFGKCDGGEMTVDRLERLIAELPGGVSEFGLHPATASWAGPDAPPPHWRAADELAALLDPRLPEACRRHGVRLTRYSDLAGS